MYVKINTKLYIHKGFLFILPAAFLCAVPSVYFSVLLCALLHEGAHLAAAVLCKEPPERLFVTPCGFELRIKAMPFCAECAVIAAGPCFSLLFALAAAIMGNDMFFRINITLALLNLVPAFPLDGGRLLRTVLWRSTGVLCGNTVTRITGRIFAALMLAYAILICSPWLIAVSMLAFSRLSHLNGSPFQCHRKRGVVPVKCFYSNGDVPIIRLIRRFSPFYMTFVYINNCFADEDKIFATLHSVGPLAAAKDIFSEKK